MPVKILPLFSSSCRLDDLKSLIRNIQTSVLVDKLLNVLLIDIAVSI